MEGLWDCMLKISFFSYLLIGFCPNFLIFHFQTSCCPVWSSLLTQVLLCSIRRKRESEGVLILSASWYLPFYQVAARSPALVLLFWILSCRCSNSQSWKFREIPKAKVKMKEWFSWVWLCIYYKADALNAMLQNKGQLLTSINVFVKIRRHLKLVCIYTQSAHYAVMLSKSLKYGKSSLTALSYLRNCPYVEETRCNCV